MKIIFTFLIILIAVITTNTAFALSYDEPIIILNPAHNTGDSFGYSVSLYDNKIVGTSISNNTDSLDDGTAYLFDADTGTYLRQFKNPFPTLNGEFGISSSMFGDKVLIGAQYADTGNGRAGAAHLFNATNGTLIKTIPNPSPATNAQFGVSVSSTDKYLLVGAHGVNKALMSNVGEAYLFNATNGDYLRTILNPVPQNNAQFGYKVFVSGELLLVGIASDSSFPGAAYLFNATDGSLLRTFTAPVPHNSDFFSRSLGISGDKIWIGSTGIYHPGGSGLVYFFDSLTGNLLNTTSNPVPAFGDYFGQTSKYTDELFLIGAPGQNNPNGAVYLLNSTNGDLIQTFANMTSFPDQQFGNAISLYEKKFVVGVFQDNSTGQNSGAVYLFTPNCIPPLSGNWIITSSCVLSNSFVAPGNITIQNGSLLKVPLGITLSNKNTLTNNGSIINNGTISNQCGAKYFGNLPSGNQVIDGCISCIPFSVDWTITLSCQLSTSAIITGNVSVENSSVLVIPNGKSLDIDFATKHLLIKSGSKVVIKSGGKIN